MKYVAKIVNNGQEYWLRNTTWIFTEERADRFDSEQAAQIRVQEVREFLKPKMLKLVNILEVAE